MHENSSVITQNARIKRLLRDIPLLRKKPRRHPAKVEIPLAETASDEMAALYNTANRPLRIRFAHKKRKEGLTVSGIALLLHPSPTTIRKYLVIPKDGFRRTRQPPGKGSTNWHYRRNSRKSMKPKSWHGMDIRLGRSQL